MDEPVTGVTLMSDGHGVYEAHSPEAIVDLLRQGQGVFAIAVDRVWEDVETAVSTPAPRRRARAAVGGP
jgi:long-subunit acyl-CoA synthetase (AMP-forming)